MRRIAIINQKGGVGKTTTVANLGAALARLGRRVVVIDLDPQANLSLHLDVPVEQNQPSIYTVLIGETQLAAALRPTRTPNLAIVSSNIDLSGAELELASAIGRESLLRDALEAWEREAREKDGRAPADYVLIDCPPSLGLLSINGLVAASETIVTLQTEFFALQGMSKLVDVLKLLKKRLNPTLEIAGILPCMYDSRLKLAREVLAEIKNYFPGRVFGRAIGKNVKLAEAPSYGRTIFEYAPECSGSSDYQELAVELCAQETRDAELAALSRPTAGVEKTSPATPGAKTSAPAARRERKQAQAPGVEQPAPGTASSPAARSEELRNVDIVPAAPRATPTRHAANEREPSSGEAPDTSRASSVEPAPAQADAPVAAGAPSSDETLREVELVPAGRVTVIAASEPVHVDHAVVTPSSTALLAEAVNTAVVSAPSDRSNASAAEAFDHSPGPSTTALAEPVSAVFENRLASYGFASTPTLEPHTPVETVVSPAVSSPHASAAPQPEPAQAAGAPAEARASADETALVHDAELANDALPDLPSDAFLLEDEVSNG